MDMFVKLVRIGDTRADWSFCNADKYPKYSTISLGNNVFGNTIASNIPASMDLTSNCLVGFESLGNKKTGTFFNLTNYCLSSLAQMPSC